MVKRYKIPKYGDIGIKKRFAFLPKKFVTEEEEIRIWLKIYTDVYKYVRSSGVNLNDNWKYIHSELIEDDKRITIMKYII